jgi:cardiolipin synthase
LLEGGVRVFEWNGPMMHAKTAVADGCWSRVGSSNSNLASWITNRELDITIHDPPLAKQMEAIYLSDLENASEVVLDKGRPMVARRSTPLKPAYRGRHAATGSRLMAGVIGFVGTVGATLARRRELGGSEARNIALAGIGLLSMAAIALAQSWLIDFPLAFGAAWVGATLLIRAGRLHRAHRSADKTKSRR